MTLRINTVAAYGVLALLAGGAAYRVAHPRAEKAPVERTIHTLAVWSEEQCRDTSIPGIADTLVAVAADYLEPDEDFDRDHPTWRTPEKLRHVITTFTQMRDAHQAYINTRTTLIAHDCIIWSKEQEASIAAAQNKVNDLNGKIGRLNEELRRK